MSFVRLSQPGPFCGGEIRNTWVCLKHRLARKGRGKCPKCQQMMQNTGYGWRVGKKHDNDEWRKLEKRLKR